MSKEKRAGAVSKKEKPFLDIKVYEPVSKKFTLMKESETTLKLYVEFKNETSGLKSILEDSVVDALIGTLNNDPQFLQWKLKQENKISEMEVSN
ncbi:hypothetical protein [Silvanigrella sp.]|jgi:hypothetical protein|uniref:hypothetical protein n=1 Tax=Silvanigrella sp. TaxID=2024976 RepID=UPI0037C8FBD6